MRLTVKYTLNNEVRLTTGLYGMIVLASVGCMSSVRTKHAHLFAHPEEN